MTTRHAPLALTLTLALTVWACRADPGAPDLDRLGPIEDPPGFGGEPLPGPDPFIEGERRLSLGVFYEGGFSDLLAPDGETVHYYIYLGPGAALTYRQVADDDRVEGLRSDRLLHAGLGWWGGGVHSDVARDLSAWQTLHLSLRASSEAFAEVMVGLGSEDAVEQLDAADYGYEADGEWHHLAIPLADFEALGVDLEAVTAIFTLSGGAGTSSDHLKVDAVYFTAP